MAMAGCRSESSSPGNGQVPGLLHYLGEPGGMGLAAPADVGTKRWQGTFGSVLLCTDGGQTITLTGVDYQTEVPPIAIETYLRKVPDSEMRTGAGEWGVIPMRVGVPKHLANPPHIIRGDVVSPIAQQLVSTDCGDAGTETGFTEILTVLTSSQHGAHIASLTITYEHGGDISELAVPLELIMCGLETKALC